MEVILVGGLALFGYELSKNGKKPRKQPEKIKMVRFENEYPIKDDETLKGTNEIHRYANRYNHNLEASDTFKQDRLERFIGTTDYVYQTKIEQGPLFKPTEMKSTIGSDGRAITPVTIDENKRIERYLATGKMDGVRPIQQVNVGRGLNSDSAAKGGFHDMTRILPENVNSYNKQTFTGRMIPGRALTTERPQTTQVDSNRPERGYTLDQRPAMAGKSDYTAGHRRGEYMMQCTNRDSIGEHVGGAGGVEAHTITSQGYTRTRDTTSQGFHGNPGQSIGNYTTGKFVMPGTERGECGIVTNISGNRGNSVYNTNYLDPTLREQENSYEGHISNSQFNAGGYTTDSTTLQTTNRQMTSSSYAGTLTGNVKGGWTSRPTAQMTTRETTGNYQASGPAFGNYGTNTYSLKHGAEASTKAGGRAYAPPPGRRNELANPEEIMQNTLVREDANANRSSGGLKATGLNNYTNIKQLGRIEETHGVPSKNTRAVLDIAKTQLEQNPYNHSIN
jgi:hypothetical protein